MVRQVRSGQQTKNTNIKNEGPSSLTSHPPERHIRHLGATKTVNIHIGFMLEIDKIKAPFQEEIWRCGGGGGDVEVEVEVVIYRSHYINVS